MSGAGVRADLVITVREYSRTGYGLCSNEPATNAEQGLLKGDGGGKRSRRDVIVPCLFTVPSMLNTGHGFLSFCLPRWRRSTVWMLIKLSVAPVSNSAVSLAIPLLWCNWNGIWIALCLLMVTASMPMSVRRAMCFSVPHIFWGTSWSRISKCMSWLIVMRLALLI